MKCVPIGTVEDHQQFTYAGLQYVLATDSEADRHPGKRPGVVLAYQVSKRGRVPVTMMPDLDVWIKLPRAWR